MRTFFGNELDISDELIAVNGRLGQSNEMIEFKTVLRDTTNEIKVGDLRVFSLCLLYDIASIRHFKTYRLFREMRSEMDVCVCVGVGGCAGGGVGCVGGFGYVGWGVWGGVSVCVGVGGCVGVCVCGGGVCVCVCAFHFSTVSFRVTCNAANVKISVFPLPERHASIEMHRIICDRETNK